MDEKIQAEWIGGPYDGRVVEITSYSYRLRMRLNVTLDSSEDIAYYDSFEIPIERGEDGKYYLRWPKI